MIFFFYVCRILIERGIIYAKVKAKFHFPQVNALVPGLKLLEF